MNSTSALGRSLNQGNVAILAGKRNEESYGALNLVDLRLGYELPWSAARLALQFDIFNLFNLNTITNAQTLSGSVYGRVLEFITPANLPLRCESSFLKSDAVMRPLPALIRLLLAAGLAGCSSHVPDPPAPTTTIASMPDFWVGNQGSRFPRSLRGAERGRPGELDTALLPAMRNHGIDMWIVLDRENNVEPLHGELGGRIRRRPGRVHLLRQWRDEAGEDLLQLARAAGDVGDYAGLRRKAVLRLQQGRLAPLLREALRKRNPRKIGVNTSATLPEADGLTVGLRDFLVDTIGPEFASVIVSAELLVRDYRTNRTPLETKLYTELLDWSSRWMCEALSSEHIMPGKTTAEDIAWWLEDRALAAGLTGSGTPRVVRRGELLPLNAPIAHRTRRHHQHRRRTGLSGLRDRHQARGLRAKPGETEPPASIAKAWRDTLAIGELYQSQMRPGPSVTKCWEGLRVETEKRGYATAYPDAGGRAAVATAAEVGIYGHSVGNVAHDIGARIARISPSRMATAFATRCGRGSGCRWNSTSARLFRNGRQDLVCQVRGNRTDRGQWRAVADSHSRQAARGHRQR